jgi:aldehyde dehydrogenase (NAD+)
MSTTTTDKNRRAEALRRIEAEKPRLEFGGAWDYAPAPESRDHVRIEKTYDLFIGGKFVAPKSGRRFQTINPATEEVLAEVAEAGAADVDAAVQAAQEAYARRWSKLRGSERG